MNNSNRLTITMDLWDKYADVRKYFFESLKKYWPSNPYPIVMACNTDITSEKLPGELIISGNDSTDSKRHLDILKNVSTEYVLLIVEDGLLLDEVNTSRIEKILDFMDENNIDFCKMIPTPNKKGKKIKDLKKSKYINKRQPYGINYLCGIYRRSFLYSVLDSECKDSWEIEEMLLKVATESERGYYSDKIVVTDNPLNIYFCVEKGRWNNKAVRLIKSNGYEFDSTRPVWSRMHDFIAKIKHMSSALLPISFRVKLKKIFSAFGIKFATKR